jgi:MYXO-CTERM domain-containing protein
MGKSRLYLLALLACFCTTGKAENIVAVTAGAQRVQTFDSASPASLLADAAISGLQGAESIVAIDRRPSNGLIYALTNNNRIYTVNSVSGTATFVSSLSAPGGVGGGGNTGFDFDPVADAAGQSSLRVSGILLTGTTVHNALVNVDTGATVLDDPFSFAAGDPHQTATPLLPALAYANNVAGATSTSLYGLVSRPGASINPPLLVGVPSPGDGTFSTLGTLGLPNLSNPFGFDISGETGTAYAAIGTAGGPQLFTINLSTGLATLLGTAGSGVPLVGITAAVPEPAAALTLTFGLLAVGAAVARRRRRESSLGVGD